MSGESVPYHLRQNKHVDRQLFIELLSHLDRAVPIKKALYISFGGVYFEDFKLIHQVFGTKKLLSVEREPWVYQRQRRNRPYGCITCRQMTSRQLVNSIDQFRGTAASPIICWLDFSEAAARRGQLEDVGIFAAKAHHLDILRITMNVNAESLSERVPQETNDACDKRRFQQLRDGYADFIDRAIEPTDATQGGFPPFCLEMVKRSIHRGVRSSPGIVFQPLGSFTYADSNHTMLTVTGIFLREEESDQIISRTRLKGFEFANMGWNSLHINVPLLSLREKLLLDQRFGSKRSAGGVASSMGFQLHKNPDVSRRMLKSYFQFHRYYPHFHRIHY